MATLLVAISSASALLEEGKKTPFKAKKYDDNLGYPKVGSSS
jgi:hypothetical protein